MSYIDRNLLPDERIVFRTKKHIIIFLFPLICTILGIPAYMYMHTHWMLAKVAWAPLVVMAVIWLHALLEYVFSDFAVTNKRVMLREGFFTRHTNELRLTAIAQANVDQSLFGMLLGYGTVSLNSFGVFDAYPLISKPGPFQRAINMELDQHLSPSGRSEK